MTPKQKQLVADIFGLGLAKQLLDFRNITGGGSWFASPNDPAPNFDMLEYRFRDTDWPDSYEQKQGDWIEKNDLKVGDWVHLFTNDDSPVMQITEFRCFGVQLNGCYTCSYKKLTPLRDAVMPEDYLKGCYFLSPDDSPTCDRLCGKYDGGFIDSNGNTYPAAKVAKND